MNTRLASVLCIALAAAPACKKSEKSGPAVARVGDEVITADDRLDKLAEDFVEHCSTRWQTGKSMLVCIDKLTCARMFQRIQPRWQIKVDQLNALIPTKEAALAATAERPVQGQVQQGKFIFIRRAQLGLHGLQLEPDRR